MNPRWGLFAGPYKTETLGVWLPLGTLSSCHTAWQAKRNGQCLASSPREEVWAQVGTDQLILQKASEVPVGLTAISFGELR